MKEQLNNNFILAILDILPAEVNVAHRIMEILDIGKEATYRRLRNEVPFTFYEASIIARELGLSLDYITGNHENKTGIFNLNLVHADTVLLNYHKTLERYKEHMIAMKKDPFSSLSSVSNTLPYVLYASYPYITKFRLSRWFHKIDKYKPLSSLEEVFIPEEIRQTQQELIAAIQDVPQTYLIWDNNLIYSFIQEIKYFYELGYINQKDIQNLKTDLNDLLNKTESLASEGFYPNGNKITIYLSNIHFEASYTYLEKNEFQISLIRLYSVNSIDTQHPDICCLQKEWIKTLKRYSTLITESGQMQRISFFKQQRKFVEEL